MYNKNKEDINYFLIAISSEVKNIKTLKDIETKDLTDTLLLHYFTNNQRSSEYKYIPKQLLENKMFVYSIISHNEDLFNYLNKDLQKEVFEIFRATKIDFIKFANDEEKADKQNIELAMRNNKSNIFHLLPETITISHVASYLQHTDHFGTLDDKALKNLDKLLPETLKTEENFLHCFQRGSYQYIQYAPEKLRNDELLAKQILIKEPTAFKRMSPDLLNNDKFVNGILTDTIRYIKNKQHASHTFEYKFLGKNNGKTKGINEFLKSINSKYLTENVCDIFKANISEIYTELSKEQQNNELIIKTIFKYEENKNVYENYSKLPKEHKDLKDLIKEYVKQERKKNRFGSDEDISKNVEKMVDYYFLTKEYNLQNHNKAKSLKQKI